MLTPMLRRRAALALVGVLATPGLRAQGARPLRILIGFPPGGGIDILARLMAPRMAEKLGTPVVVENRPGANGVVATQQAAQSEPDGSLLFMGTTGNLAVNAALYPDAGFDLLRDFTPLTLVATLPFFICANAGLGVNTLAELIALATSRPGALNFASSGNGGLPHLAGELLNEAAGIRTVHIPYRGSAPAFTDVVSGQAQFTIDALAPAQPYLAAGRLRALATTGSGRAPGLPQIPAAQETLRDYVVTNWYGMVLRAGTPPATVERLHAAVTQTLAEPELRRRAEELGLELIGGQRETFAALQRASIDRWGAVVRRAGIRPD